MKFTVRVLAKVVAAGVIACGQTEIENEQVAAQPPMRTSSGVSEAEAWLLILLCVVVIGGFIVLRRKD